ncbi:hypothetical protein [Lewinella sp. IMCC34183]|uniref:hypothetical protein n=1 Tax=Lewinella sp. IMCC34183 TaxID=2248762 RepID=UPI000E27254C|nr:hypothetical protein [Lewinella sp. IMCC34183]
MGWQKLGRFFETARQQPFMVSHACTPTALYLPASDRIRVYFAPRNARGQSLPTYLEVAAADPTRVLYLHDRPVLELGVRGTFDDGGIMPCSLAEAANGDLCLYYVGWNPSVSVAYRNAVGLAISTDGGRTFKRPFPGAVVDRNRTEPFFTASPCVLREGDTWHLWYASSTGFLEVEDRIEPLYVLKYAQSADGVEWHRDNRTLLAPASPHECTARPTVVRDGDTYRMWYCYRGSADYRDGKDAYRIGYAESRDARNWERRDAQAGIDYSTTGWDATMQTYPNVLDTPHGRYLFYNGNGFGKTGIGCARWQQTP